MTKFSVIVPLYNKAPYVEKALSSIAAQTFKDYELVVVDDGSEDDSASVAGNCISAYWPNEDIGQNVQLIRQSNTGVSVARNNGVLASHGEFVCFLDADDWWTPTFLEEISKLIDDYPDSGIYGTNYVIVNETKKKTRVSPISVEKDFQKGYINYCRVYAETLAMPLWTGAITIPRRVFDVMGGFKPWLKLGEDFDLWIRISLSHKVAFLNKPLAIYNQDVDVNNRGVGRLHAPVNHMLWNLGYLQEEEQKNSDYKILIDRLRVYGIMPYYLSSEFHQDALTQLNKVSWDNVDPIWDRKYNHTPLILLRISYSIRKLASKIKTKLI